MSHEKRVLIVSVFVLLNSLGMSDGAEESCFCTFVERLKMGHVH